MKALPRRYRRLSPQAQRLADRALKQIALECHKKAQTIREPTLVRQHAEEALQVFVSDMRHHLNWPKHGAAYKLLKARWRLLLSGSRFDRDKYILDWTVRLMMDGLLEWSMYDPEKRCVYDCGTCRKCQRALVFPYKWKKTDAALAAKTAFERASIQPYRARRWTVDAILKIYQRHARQH